MDTQLQTLYPLERYTQLAPLIDFEHPLIQKHLKASSWQELPEQQRVQVAFEFVRDAVAHSWDIQSRRVTARASEVLRYREGICYAKSHLLAALLRGMSIPAGICYQRLTLGDTPEMGYVVHALNTVYLLALRRWIRLDARGNKPGVNAQFSLVEEQLAFPIREEYGEIDYLVNYAEPHPQIVATLIQHTDCQEMCSHGLPTDLAPAPSPLASV